MANVKLTVDTNLPEVLNESTNALKDLKTAYKEAMSEAVGGNEDAIKKAGALKDQLNDLNESVKQFAGGSQFEQFGNVLGGVAGKIRDLDFNGASENAKRLIDLSKAMTFKEAIGGVKDLGTTFVNLGRALLANPLFLIGAVIVGVGFAIVALKDKVAFISDIFFSFNEVLNFVIQSLKDFTDWMGITTFAQDELAENIVDNNKKIIQSNTERYDKEIRLAKAAGRDTTNLEAQKLGLVIASNRIIIAELEKVQARRKEMHVELTEDQKKQLDEAYENAEEANIELIELDARVNKKLEDQRNDYVNNLVSNYQREKDGEIAIKKAKGEDAYKLERFQLQDRLDRANEAHNKISRLDFEAKEKAKTAVIDADTKLKLFDIEHNNTLIENQKKRIQESGKLWMEEGKLKKSIADEAEAKREAEADDIIKEIQNTSDFIKSNLVERQDAEAETIIQQLILKSNRDEAEIEAEYEKTDKLEEASKARAEKLARIHKQLVDDVDATNKEAQQKMAAEVIMGINSVASSITTVASSMNDYNQTIANEAVKSNQLALNKQLQDLTTVRDAELAVENLTTEQKTDIENKYKQAKFALETEEYNRTNRLKKDAFEQDKKFKIASSVISTLTGGIAAVTGMIQSIPGPAGIALGAIAGLAVVAAGQLQIAKIKATTFGAGQAPSAPSLNFASNASSASGQAQGASPTQISLYGTAGAFNNQGANQGGQGYLESYLLRAVVVESDITSSQQRMANFTNSSSIGG